MRARETHPFLAGLGKRVRYKRWTYEYTLKEVAEKSGLSERFLAAIEHGKANVSVLNLIALAQALHTDIATLISESALYVPGHRMLLALIGLRGAGKSSIGRAAAERLDVGFIELDARITERTGMSAGEIFDVHGASYYRRIERGELEHVFEQRESAILATAGSLVTDHATYELLLERATVVWLKATPEDHHDRVLAQGDARPMADRKNAKEELRAILRARRALYERAHHVIDTSRMGFEKSVARLVEIGIQARTEGPPEKIRQKVAEDRKLSRRITALVRSSHAWRG
jgi:XRE family aerobic/anaerobic benzoate catabolism transcriptional regulator